ncbi:MAG TPA: hypothetical protein VGP47_00910 [Parachlamydiaceae bacterium]|nr:hypothetical protein [Parachlamydiaceae bacterium]
MIKNLKRLMFLVVNSTVFLVMGATTDNQTDDLSLILVNRPLPFQIKVELAGFTLPNGIHSYAQSTFDGKWLFIAGRTNGMHSFLPGDNNFPPSAQNQVIYVVDPVTQTVYSKSLTDPKAGLTAKQIDLLSVTNPQFYTLNCTLYMTGGYGVDSETGLFSTKDALSAINVPRLMQWVMNPDPQDSAANYIRQIFHPVFQITGGSMFKFAHHPTLLVFGQNFEGFYHDDSNGDYSEQVRRFDIIDDGNILDVDVKPSKPHCPLEIYRRRDLNIVPIIHYTKGRYRQQLIAFSGVFTLEEGIWTIPVNIDSNGNSSMLPPTSAKAFKQGMNNYSCPTIGLFSQATKDMYTIFMGGISYGYFIGDIFFATDAEIPFINQITTIKYSADEKYTQYLMDEEYPVIISTGPNAGNPLLFGASAMFIPSGDALVYGHDVLNLDALTGSTVIGYVVGGIQSTVPNTSVPGDSAASPYIFKVSIIR